MSTVGLGEAGGAWGGPVRILLPPSLPMGWATRIALALEIFCAPKMLHVCLGK